VRRQTGLHDRSTLLVMSKRCDQCLFSNARIVSAARAAEHLEHIERKDAHFVCHKSTLRNDRGVMCRGDWDRDNQRTLVMRLAQRLGVVQFVDEADL
jgi:hypothetical protein